MSTSQDNILQKYPLHLAIWNNDLAQIKLLLSAQDAQVSIDNNIFYFLSNI